MKIIINNGVIQFNSTDYNWQEIPISANMFLAGKWVAAGLPPTGTYRGCAITNKPNMISNSEPDDYIDVSNFGKLKFDVIVNQTATQNSPGYCLYDSYIDITWYAGNSISQHVVESGCFVDDTKTYKTVIVDVPVTAKALRFTLPASYGAENIKVYGVER